MSSLLVKSPHTRNGQTVELRHTRRILDPVVMGILPLFKAKSTRKTESLVISGLLKGKPS